MRVGVASPPAIDEAVVPAPPAAVAGRAEANVVAAVDEAPPATIWPVIGGPFHTTVASLSSSVSCGKTRSTGGWVATRVAVAGACVFAGNTAVGAVTGPVTGRDPVVAPPAADMVAGPS